MRDATDELPTLSDPAGRRRPGPAARWTSDRRSGRPLWIGGALTSAALSLAGAAYLAWRFRRPPSTAMARAVRAVGSSEALLMPLKLPSFRARRNAYPPDLWTKCPQCEEMLFNKQLDKALRVCPNCGHHFRLSAAARLDQLLDPGSWRRARRRASCRSTRSGSSTARLPGPAGRRPARDGDARRCACGAPRTLGGTPVAICVMDFGFMGGSMGAVVGEKVDPGRRARARRPRRR